MKKKNIINKLVLFVMMLQFFSLRVFGQIVDSSAIGNGESVASKFDNVFGMDGKMYKLSSLRLPDSTGHFKGNANAKMTNKLLCSSGYFDLWFEQDWNGIAPNQLTPAQSALAQATICKVFQDISNFIQRPVGATDHVQIWIRDLSQMSNVNLTTSNIRGGANNFSYVPWDCPTKSGIADNLIWLTINGGKDAYTNIAASLVTNAQANPQSAGYFHGMFGINFSNPATVWNLDFNAVPNTWTSQLDLYAVLMHEMMHCLGFQSNINNNGTSVFMGAINNNNPSFNYLTRYDLNLQTSAGATPSNAKLLSTPYATQNPPNVVYQNNYTLTPTSINGNCVNTGTQTNNATSCTNTVVYNSAAVPNIPVCLPACFALGESLSHLIDACPTLGGSCGAACEDLYYLMSPGIGNGAVKRGMKDQERKILNDIGYTVGNSFGTATTWNGTAWGPTTYSNTLAGGVQVVGYCDGVANGAYTYSLNAGSTITIPISALIANDYNATGINTNSVEVMNSTGSTATVSAGNITFTAASTASGVVLIRYIPIRTVGTTIYSGNITYLYVAINSNCPPSPCNLISNGGFEDSPTGCANFIYSPAYDDILCKCWKPYCNSPRFKSYNCSLTGNELPTPPTPVYGLIPNVNTWNTNNNKILQLDCSASGVNLASNAIQTSLSAPLITGNYYTLNFKAMNANYANTLPYKLSFMGSIATLVGSVNFNFNTTNTGLLPIVPNLININIPLTFTNNWTTYSFAFQYTGTAPINNLVIGVNGLLPTDISDATIFLDDVELIPSISNVSFTPPSTAPCNKITNLAQYLTPTPTGIVTFSGTNNSVYQNGTQWDFDPALAGNGNQIITAQYTNANGCKVNLSANILVSIIPQLSITGNTCLAMGANTSLSVSPIPSGASMVWKYNGSNIGTINPITVTQLGTYSVTVTSASGGCTNATTITINPLPSITPTATPSTICNGSSSTLTATGATNYSWMPGNLTGSSVSVSPTSSTIYTVTGTNATASCSNTSTVAVTVLAPLPPFTIASAPCPLTGGTATLTVSSMPTGATVSWKNSTGVVGTTNPIVITQAGTYTVTVTNTVGCSSTAVIDNNSPCNSSLTATLPPTITSSPTPTPNGFALTAPTTITGNVAFTGTDIAISNGASITVANGATLTIEASHLHGCAANWAGIAVSPGGKLIVKGNAAGASSFIEDAKIAISVYGHTATAPIIDISNTVFNKNYVGIDINTYLQNVSPYPFKIENCIFTCRQIPTLCGAYPNWYNVSTLNVATANASNVLLSPCSTLTSFPSVFVLGYNGEVSNVHIKCTSVGYTGGTALAPTYTGILAINSLGGAGINIFDNAYYSIYSMDCNLQVVNNIVQNNNFGIYAFNTVGVPRAKIQLPYSYLGVYNSPSSTNTTGGNKFYNNANTDLIASAFANMDIIGNEFRSTQSASNLVNNGSSSLYNGNIVGKVAINIGGYNTIAHNIKYNTIYNHKLGIGINQSCAPTPGSTTTLTNFPGDVQVTNNTIAPSPAGNTIGITPFVSEGISASMSGGTSLASTYTVVATYIRLNIQSNTINNVWRGIEVNSYNWTKHSVLVQNNTITQVPDINTSTLAMQHGIWCTHNRGSLYVAANKVDYTGTIPSTVSSMASFFNANANKSGRQSNYRMDQNDRQVITCNQSLNANIGFEFNGAVGGGNTQWQKNIMSPNAGNKHFIGMLLNNAAIIGMQPCGQTTLCASNCNNIDAGNTWNFTANNLLNTPKHTWVQNACNAPASSPPCIALSVGAQLSPMQVPSSGPNVPTANSGNGGNIIRYNFTFYSLIPVTGASNGCAMALPAKRLGIPSTIGDPAVLSALAVGINFDSNSVALNYANQGYLYCLQKADPDYQSATTALQSFYTTANAPNSQYRKLYNIDSSLLAGNGSTAQSLNTAFVPANIAETNAKSYNTINIKYKSGIALAPEDQNELLRIGNLCPHTIGACVYAARILYNSMAMATTGNYYSFADDCSSGGGLYKTSPSINNASVTISAFNVTIYPNPTGGVVNIDCSNCTNNTNVLIEDATGKIVYNKTLRYTNGEKQIDLPLAKGMYIVIISNNDTKETSTKKLIVQ